jgi:hypothetical protein
LEAALCRDAGAFEVAAAPLRDTVAFVVFAAGRLGGAGGGLAVFGFSRYTTEYFADVLNGYRLQMCAD